MIAYWFAINIDNLEMAQAIYKLDPIIEKVMRSLREQGEPELEDKRRRMREAERKKQAKIKIEVQENDSDNPSPEKSDTLKLPDINKK